MFFYEHQYGFRQKHSTQQAIITLVDKITTSLDKGDIIISVFLDLKKAFDTVDHHILFRKSYAYGIHGHIIKWFESYLYDRSQYVIYNNEVLFKIFYNLTYFNFKPTISKANERCIIRSPKCILPSHNHEYIKLTCRYQLPS